MVLFSSPKQQNGNCSRHLPKKQAPLIFCFASGQITRSWQTSSLEFLFLFIVWPYKVHTTHPQKELINRVSGGLSSDFTAPLTLVGSCCSRQFGLLADISACRTMVTFFFPRDFPIMDEYSLMLLITKGSIKKGSFFQLCVKHDPALCLWGICKVF